MSTSGYLFVVLLMLGTMSQSFSQYLLIKLNGKMNENRHGKIWKDYFVLLKKTLSCHLFEENKFFSLKDC